LQKQNTTTNSNKKSRSSNNNLSKASLHFLTVSREKNQIRQYFDWNNQPMLLINQNEVEPKKMAESHHALPDPKFRSKTAIKFSGGR
jgi:hypothetical protein